VISAKFSAGRLAPSQAGPGAGAGWRPFGKFEDRTLYGGRLSAATCVFCTIINGEQPTVTILETERLIAFLDHRPLFHGHTLLVPKQHVRLLSELPAEQVPEFFTTAQRLERAVEDGLGADGSMILINNVVSQSVPHLHLHVIPRNKRDGLRFWLGPRHPYDDAHPAEAYAEKIRAALPN
jgi:histidine triad (HIT) family protein